MKRFSYYVPALITGALLFMLHACNKEVSVLIFDTPKEESSYTLTITTKQSDLLPVTGYTLKITGPVAATVVLQEEKYTFEGAIPGTYTIEVSKDGYIGSSKTVVLESGSGEGSVLFYSASMYLTRKRPPVTVSNATGGTITIQPAATGGAGIGARPVTAVIPPGAIEGAGSTAITITPVPIDPTLVPASTPSGATAGYYLVFEPSGLQFKSPIRVDVPLEFSSAAARAIPFKMVYRTVNPTTRAVTYSTNPADILPVTISADGKTGTVMMTHFSEWQIIGDYKIETTSSLSPVTEFKSSACGEGVSGTYTKSGNMGPLYTELMNIPQANRTVTLSQPFNFEGVEFFTRHIGIRHMNITYTVRRLDNNAVLETFTIPDPEVTVEIAPTLTSCHNSGGN